MKIKAALKRIKYGLIIMMSLVLFSASNGAAQTCAALLNRSEIDPIERLAVLEAATVESLRLETDFQRIAAFGKLYERIQVLIDEFFEGPSIDDVNELNAISLANFDELSVDQIERLLTGKIIAKPAEKQINFGFEALTGFQDIEPNRKYTVASRFESTYAVEFTEKLLKALNSHKLGLDYKRHFFNALKKGIQSGTMESGIKIMKTFEKISFAEIKLIGRSGNKRIYGDVINGNEIVFHTIGDHSESSGDILHNRLRSTN